MPANINVCSYHFDHQFFSQKNHEGLWRKHFVTKRNLALVRNLSLPCSNSNHFGSFTKLLFWFTFFSIASSNKFLEAICFMVKLCINAALPHFADRFNFTAPPSFSMRFCGFFCVMHFNVDCIRVFFNVAHTLRLQALYF